jgi:arginyl-tRNA synthetase
MSIEQELIQGIQKAFKEVYNTDTPAAPVIEQTKREFVGDYTFVVFPYLKLSKKKPEQTGNDIGEFLKKELAFVSGFNVIKGFLNIEIGDSFWVKFLNDNYALSDFGKSSAKNKKIMVEYSSPNTNKPLHLGHIRNNLLGYAVAEILAYNGYEVIKANLINDRGIHICKSMLAWMKFGNGETPQSSGMKGDHLVGKYYVEFDKAYKAEIDQLVSGGMEKEHAEQEAPLIKGAKELLLKWEQGDAETLRIWKMMNGWVYEGFELTYKRLGVNFDKFYYESNTYLLGKKAVQEGLQQGAFYQKEDGSIWIDLTADGLDHKLLQRSDGTSVYITQDIGTAQMKYDEYKMDRSVYVVGNEQDYHFKVLQLILKHLGKVYAYGVYHLSYGMVDLPSGKMKSREGTVVDADDLLDELHHTSEKITKELGKTEGFTQEQLSELYEQIGQGALKYFLLKVDPKKRLLFDPKESIDFQGNTGPFIQYTYARISSVMRSAPAYTVVPESHSLLSEEKELIYTLYRFNEAVELAGKEMSPAVMANYAYELVKAYNKLYHELTILKETDEQKRNLRLMLSAMTRNVVKTSLRLLGIAAPEKM